VTVHRRGWDGQGQLGTVSSACRDHAIVAGTATYRIFEIKRFVRS
jgi:hypothetical protein